MDKKSVTFIYRESPSIDRLDREVQQIMHSEGFYRYQIALGPDYTMNVEHFFKIEIILTPYYVHEI